jgi:transcriptional regulator with XRE-family HTH domain
MTGDEFKERLTALGWKQADFARSTGITKISVSNWANGHPIPEWVASYLHIAETLRTLIAIFRDDPRLVALDVAEREIFHAAKGR